ncbi:MAG: GTP cyclohydrolase IIa [Candidatus Lokiarchaeota archaeon]|nr:GTP cyclohydrolase IIa [Candidatus Lokiarchaeota archaeon]
MIQITTIQIDNFGPFTEDLGNNREHKIQLLLSELYIFLQKCFNKYNSLVFSASKDILIAVTNGISIEVHQEIIDKVKENFPITISIGIGVGSTPLDAQIESSNVLKPYGSAQSSRKSILAHNGKKIPINNNIKVAHIDINFYTKLATDVNPFYINYISLNKSYATLMEYFKEINTLCFFNGGDNFICICSNDVKRSDIENILNKYEEKYKPWKLKAGIGQGENILEAISEANIFLHKIRKGHNQEKILGI